MFWTPVSSFAGLQHILAAFVLIFLIGTLNDLRPISPRKKVVGQLLVAVLLSLKVSVRVTSFYGFLGIHTLSEPARFLLSLWAIVGIINAFNLIDGINGLAGSVDLLTCFLLGSFGLQRWI